MCWDCKIKSRYFPSLFFSFFRLLCVDDLGASIQIKESLKIFFIHATLQVPTFGYVMRRLIWSQVSQTPAQAPASTPKKVVEKPTETPTVSNTSNRMHHREHQGFVAAHCPCREEGLKVVIITPYYKKHVAGSRVKILRSHLMTIKSLFPSICPLNQVTIVEKEVEIHVTTPTQKGIALRS